MENFTPVSGLIGGLLIGGASAFLLMFSGRIAGISGILGGVLTGDTRERSWRAAFIVGLVAGPLAYAATTGAMPDVVITPSTGLLIAGGLLVGFGTRLGSGCTSGHGVCGLARLAPRSLVATAVFMATAGIVVFLVRHVIGG